MIGSNMTRLQKDLGFLLLVTYGREPFYFAQMARLRATIEAWSNDAAGRDKLYTDKLINDDVIQRTSDVNTVDEQQYRLTDKFLEEIKNEK